MFFSAALLLTGAKHVSIGKVGRQPVYFMDSGHSTAID